MLKEIIDPLITGGQHPGVHQDFSSKLRSETGSNWLSDGMEQNGS